MDGHTSMYGCESWTIKKAECQKNWCFWTVVLEKILESPLDSKEIKAVSPKGNQPWIFIGRTDAEAKAPILWPPDVKKWLLGKDPDAGKDWGQEKGVKKDKTVGCHHWFSGHEFEQTWGDSEGQGSLLCCSSWGRKESGIVTEQQQNYIFLTLIQHIENSLPYILPIICLHYWLNFAIPLMRLLSLAESD